MEQNIYAGESRLREMVSFPPLLPSSSWMSYFLKAYSLKKDKGEAFREANLNLTTSKEFGRTLIPDTRNEPLTLSMAVEGGGRNLRSMHKVSSLRLSDHGDWRKVHLRAMDACLGRKPFYPHVFPIVASVYEDRGFMSLKDFNSAIFERLLSFLINDIPAEMLAEFFTRTLLRERGEEIASKIEGRLSFLSILTEYGKESLLGFMAYKN